ncbi:MAG: hypothetical protein M1821_006755 [Bathelium mastoideum]|nr:MAG: hypothetical protein M1821_006755 [Bathelium mastoideum]
MPSAKRKSPASSSIPPPTPKKPHVANGDVSPEPKYDHSRVEERYGIVQRKFYPQEMSNERCEQYNGGEIRRPIELLTETINETAGARRKIQKGDAVVHWFKRDLRLFDNRALHLASEKAKSLSIPLICLFILSPEDYQAHCTSPSRIDFELRSLEILKADLAEIDIPLYTTTISERKRIPESIIQQCEDWGAKHIFCNIEYEVDELRRETLLTRKCLKRGIDFTAVHDDVVVAPGQLQTGAGKQFSVYSPWYRAWVAHIHRNPELLNAYPPPAKNPDSARTRFEALFEAKIPPAPKGKTLSAEEKTRFESMWPTGEHEGQDRLEKFLGQKVAKYKDTRNFPAANSTAMVSVHLSAGTLAARTAVRRARESNSTQKLDGGNVGISGWISELAWRDFYKHVLAHWPYVCMNKPFKFEYTNIEWEYNDEHFAAWCEGRTGFPIVDAAMRQLNHMGYMHNRCRMIVASFLAKDLLIDWRMGEKYFMEHLVDGDFASNNGGWGFSASTGVDPQPYFRIFNPLLQSEKFDAQGDYIRKWVEELKDVKGNAVHAPYERGAERIAKQRGYPKPIVDHKVCRDRALSRYKAGLNRDTA